MFRLTLVAWLAAAPLQEIPPVPAEASPAGEVDAVSFHLLKYVDRVERDGTFVRTGDFQVRLRTAEGVAAFGQIGELYLDGYGEVHFEDVLIEKVDGRRMAVADALEEDLTPVGVTTTSMPPDVRYKKITIPGLEPGDRLSYRIVHRRKPVAPGRAFGELKLAPATGAPKQVYELDLPRDAGIKVRLRQGIGTEWEEVPSGPDRWVRRLSLTVASLDLSKKSKEEAERLAEPDVIFTSFDSWDEVAGWWWGISKDRLAPDDAVSQEAASLVASAGTPREKLAALHAFLAARIRYANVSFGLGRMQPRSAPEVLANRYGDCKDKYALLAALAASLGIDVRPVLINSARSGLRDDVPSPQQFDHVISVARLGASPEDWLWLDGTNPFGGPGYLIPALRDKSALLIEAGGGASVVRTPKDPPYLFRQDMAFKGTLDAEGLLRGRFSWSLRSDLEMMLRPLFANLAQEDRATAIQAGIAQRWGANKVENVFVSDPLDVDAPFRLEFDAEKQIEAKEGERNVGLAFGSFDLPEPAHDLPPGEPAFQFGLREMTERAEVQIPEEQHARAPLPVSAERSFGAFRSTYSIEGHTLKLERRLTFSQPSLPVSEVASYEAFRSAVKQDHEQEFVVAGIKAAPVVVTDRTPPDPPRR